MTTSKAVYNVPVECPESKEPCGRKQLRIIPVEHVVFYKANYVILLDVSYIYHLGQS